MTAVSELQSSGLSDHLYDANSFDLQISNDSIRIMGEATDISALTEDAATYVAEDVTFRLRDIIDLSRKMMEHSKRSILFKDDIDGALKCRNLEPLLGHRSKIIQPFRCTNSGRREVFYKTDEDIDVQKLLSIPAPKAPPDIILRAHWVAIDGVQPAIPENPVVPAIKPKEQTGQNSEKMSHDDSFADTFDSPAMIHLPAELQLYYKEITEACVGHVKLKRGEALCSLAIDPGLMPLMPRFSNFISEGIKLKLSENDIPTLIYLIGMLKALVNNPNVSLEKFLHELLPVACSAALFNYPSHEATEIWNLRSDAAAIVGRICHIYNNCVNNIQTRLTKHLFAQLSENGSLGTHFGAISIISELGQEAVKILLLPLLQNEGEMLKVGLESTSEMIIAQRVQTLMVKTCAPAIVATRHPPDLAEEFEVQFGYLGKLLWNEVRVLRPQITAPDDGNVLLADSPINDEEIVDGDYNTDADISNLSYNNQSLLMES